MFLEFVPWIIVEQYFFEKNSIQDCIESNSIKLLYIRFRNVSMFSWFNEKFNVYVKSAQGKIFWTLLTLYITSLSFPGIYQPILLLFLILLRNKKRPHTETAYKKSTVVCRPKCTREACFLEDLVSIITHWITIYKCNHNQIMIAFFQSLIMLNKRLNLDNHSMFKCQVFFSFLFFYVLYL